jgi:hypothetical protein
MGGLSSGIDRFLIKGEGLDHVAIATKDSRKTLEALSVLGFATVLEGKDIGKFNVRASKAVNAKGETFEVIEDYSEESPVRALLGEEQAKIYHFCVKVDDFDARLESLRRLGAVIVTSPFESLIFEGYRTCHLYHEFLGLFELFGR